MKTEFSLVAGMIAVALLAARPGVSAPMPNAQSVPGQIVITVRPAPNGGLAEKLEAGDVTASEGNTRVPVVSLQRLVGDLAGMQLFIFLDDSTRLIQLGHPPARAEGVPWNLARRDPNGRRLHAEWNLRFSTVIHRLITRGRRALCACPTAMPGRKWQPVLRALGSREALAFETIDWPPDSVDVDGWCGSLLRHRDSGRPLR